MLKTPAYAAASATTPLGPFSIEHREASRRDVRIDILYCGVCHSDIHRPATNGAARSSRWCRTTRSSAPW